MKRWSRPWRKSSQPHERQPNTLGFKVRLFPVAACFHCKGSRDMGLAEVGMRIARDCHLKSGLFMSLRSASSLSAPLMPVRVKNQTVENHVCSESAVCTLVERSTKGLRKVD